MSETYADSQFDLLEAAYNEIPIEAKARIEQLESSLNEVADRWAGAQIEAENYALENMLLKIDNDTRWYELFGTPEQAAQTLLYVLACKDSRPWVACEECPILGGCAVRSDGHDALLEWLRGDAE